MDWNAFMKMVLEVFPNASVGEDTDGELLIYTNLRTVERDGIEEIEPLS